MPIVVSRILRVHGSSGHQPGSKNLQNKQGTGGGVSAGSPMLKLVKKIESFFFLSDFQAYLFSISFSERYLPYLSRRIIHHSPLSMGRSPFYGKWVIGLRNGRDADASLAFRPFFLLGNQVARVFRLKDRLAILRAVSYEVCERISSQDARNLPGTYWPAIFLKMAAGWTGV